MMDNEDFQMLVLDQLAKINKRLDFFEQRMNSIHSQPGVNQDCLTRIEDQNRELREAIASLQQRQEVLAAKLDKLPVDKKFSLVKPETWTIINEAQQLHDAWLRVLSADTAQLKAELHRLKPAK